MQIKSTLRSAPLRAIIYGRDGVGKSTFCAGAPGAVFIAVESGLDAIDTRAVEPPTSWREVIDSVTALASEPSCQTIVLDSLDWAEQLCWAHTCAEGDDKGAKRTIEDFGWGKGYVAALSAWRLLVSALEGARRAGKNILLIAHAERRSVKNPTGDDYDSMGIKLHAKAAAMLREWVDVVGLAELDVSVVERDGRQKGVTTGKRVLRTQPSPAFESKTRYALPAKIPLTWSDFSACIKSAIPETANSLTAKLAVNLAALGDPEVSEKCDAYIDAQGRTLDAIRAAIVTVQAHLAERGKACP